MRSSHILPSNGCSWFERCSREPDKTTEVIKRLRNIEPHSSKLEERLIFRRVGSSPARFIYRKFDFQQTTATTETPTFGLILSQRWLNLQSADETKILAQTVQKKNQKYGTCNIDCSFIVVDIFMVKNILQLSSSLDLIYLTRLRVSNSF